MDYMEYANVVRDGLSDSDDDDYLVSETDLP